MASLIMGNQVSYNKSCSMPKLKLIYFNIEGHVELTRWIFAYSEIPYEDVRIDLEDWPEFKKQITDGLLPVLMVDDKPLPESVPIARYAAYVAGLVPEDNYDSCYIDALAEVCCKELMEEVLHKVLFSNHPPAEKKRLLTEDIIPRLFKPHLEVMEERLASRNWFIAEKPTWGDLILGFSCRKLTSLDPDFLNEYPNLRKHSEKVNALPAITKWLRTRPATMREEEWFEKFQKLNL